MSTYLLFLYFLVINSILTISEVSHNCLYKYIVVYEILLNVY